MSQRWKKTHVNGVSGVAYATCIATKRVGDVGLGDKMQIVARAARAARVSSMKGVAGSWETVDGWLDVCMHVCMHLCVL